MTKSKDPKGVVVLTVEDAGIDPETNKRVVKSCTVMRWLGGFKFHSETTDYRDRIFQMMRMDIEDEMRDRVTAELEEQCGIVGAEEPDL